MLTRRERNISIDIMRVLAATMVVYQHACGNTVVELCIESLAKIAVPLFLMITGYYYKDVAIHGRIKSQVTKILRYACMIVGFYFLIDIVHALLKHNIVSYLSQYAKTENAIRFLVFNDPIPGDHSWYLWALLYVLVIAWAVPRLLQFIKPVTALCLILLLCVGKYSPFIFGKSLEYIYCRNFLATGMPFFLLGNILHDLEEKIRMNKSIWKYLVFLFSITSIVEYLVSFNMGIVASGYYISTVLLAVSVFCYFQTKEWKQKFNKVAVFGRKYIFGIYLIHVEFVVIEKKYLMMNNGMGVIGFICVLVISVFASMILTNCTECMLGLIGRRKV